MRSKQLSNQDWNTDPVLVAALAVILAAAAGTRLRPITDVTPECLIEVSGRPIVGRLLDVVFLMNEAYATTQNAAILAAAGRRSVGASTRRDFLSRAYVVCALLNGIAAAFMWHAAVTIGSAIVTTFPWIAWGGPEVYADADGPAPGPVG